MPASRSTPDADRPLGPVDFLILLALVDRERHGYGIVRDVAAWTDGRVRLDPGNLYRSVRRMLGWGWIERAARRPSRANDDERRQYYRLSDRGRRAVAVEADRLNGLVQLDVVRRLIAGSEAR